MKLECALHFSLILTQTNSIHKLTPSFLKTDLIILSSLFPSGFYSNTLYVFKIIQFLLHVLPILLSLNITCLLMGWSAQVTEFLNMYFSFSYYFLSLRSKYSQHSNSQIPSIFFVWCNAKFQDSQQLKTSKYDNM